MARKAAPSTESTEPKLPMAKIMALKKKSLETSGSLWLKMGLKKLEIPATVQILESDGDVFISFKGTSSIFKTNDSLKKLEHHPAMDEAYKKLLKAGRSERPGKAASSIPQALLDELAALEKKMAGSGFKIGYDPKAGMVKVVKPRAKRK